MNKIIIPKNRPARHKKKKHQTNKRTTKNRKKEPKELRNFSHGKFLTILI